MEIKFSIILPTYNRANFISKAIKSVLDQSYTNWELIIVDDGSSDNTKEVVSGFDDDRIKYVFQENQERSAARNNGVKLAEGNYVCFLDSDDYYLNHFLKSFYELIQANNYNDAFYACNTYREVEGGKLEEVDGFNKRFSAKYDFLLTNFIGTPRVCLPTKHIKSCPFDLTVKNGEDFELWFRVVEELDIITTDAYTQVFVDHESRSISTNQEQQLLDALTFLFDIQERHKQRFSKEAIAYFKVENNLRMARFYFSQRSKKATKYILKVLSNTKGHQKKEALYMLTKLVVSGKK